MAIGFSKMLGIDIAKNFDLPYISKNVTEFWKRWHISLSSWLQEYVYISLLGGNRKGNIRTQVNLILTMLIGGLWHGANWTFIAWGGIHGIALVIHKKYHQWTKDIVWVQKLPSWAKGLGAMASTFVYITITWVFFRASSLNNAWMILKQVVTMQDGIVHIYAWTWLAILFCLAEAGYAVFHKYKKKEKQVTVTYPILQLNTVKNLMIFFTFVGLTIILAYVGDTVFIYGKF